MAATAGDSAANSPRFRRSNGRNPPAWAQTVRGGVPEADPASRSPSSSPSPPPPSAVAPVAPPPPLTEIQPPEPADRVAPDATPPPPSDPDGNGVKGNKRVWAKPSVEGTVEAVPPVMDTSSWPELSQAAAKASPKPSPEPSLNVLPDGSAPLSPGPVPASSPQRANSSNNTSPQLNHPAPGRQRSLRRGGGYANGSGPGPVLPIPSPLAETSRGGPERSPSSAVALEASPREHPNRGNNWGEHGSRQTHAGGGDTHRNSYRRGNNGHYYGNRRDHDRDWNSNNRNFNGRDFHMQHPRNVHRPFVRPVVPPPGPPPPPVVSAPFMGHPSIRPPPLPFMGMNEMGPVQYYYFDQRLSYVPPGPTFFSPPVDYELIAKLTKQIDYYFSDENLFKDTYLKKHMNEEGWVPISLIAGFNRVVKGPMRIKCHTRHFPNLRARTLARVFLLRHWAQEVKQLTTDNQIIFNALRASAVVEVQGDMIRRRYDWKKWLLDPEGYSGSLVAQVQRMGLDGGNGAHIGRSSSGELSL
ncbi:hypothetical protein QJS04_geneDACA001243 [Acorus gramineus]|uniref:HTH La-type RNA-binding domain-containing protein n=1 Tax=Acorus gramineus TaxID=55184 RepID=A0AAV9AEE3_ACOGR|nr:hypothetical protein QJS04_geneDACA001243 [Acorus gramineus]